MYILKESIELKKGEIHERPIVTTLPGEVMKGRGFKESYRNAMDVIFHFLVSYQLNRCIWLEKILQTTHLGNVLSLHIHYTSKAGVKERQRGNYPKQNWLLASQWQRQSSNLWPGTFAQTPEDRVTERPLSEGYWPGSSTNEGSQIWRFDIISE